MATGRAILDSNPIDIDAPTPNLPAATKTLLEQIAAEVVAYQERRAGQGRIGTRSVRDEAISSNIIETIAGHGGFDDSSALFIFEAPNGIKPDGTVLVEVTVESWNALWDHTLNSHSRASATPKVTFASAVALDD